MKRTLAILILSLSLIFSPILAAPVQAIGQRVECLVLHDYQYQKQWRSQVPEVYHFDQWLIVPLTREWQEIILALNPGMTASQFRSLLKWDRAFTNGGVGFDFPGGAPRADFIGHRDMNAKLPAQDKPRTSGGYWIRGTLANGILTIETLNGKKPPPPLSYILANHLYFEAFTVRVDGTPGRFPQRGGKPVYWPLVASGPVTVKVENKITGKPYPYIKYCRILAQ